MRIKIMLAVILIFTSVSLYAQYYEQETYSFDQGGTIEFGIRTGPLYGHTLYQIGFSLEDANYYYDFPYLISQLKFPIAAPVIEPYIQVNYNEHSVRLEVQKNYPMTNGKMEDTDWGAWYQSGASWADYTSKDIFSTSDALLDLWKARFLYSYVFSDLGFVKTMLDAGLTWDHYSYEVYDLDQYYPSYTMYSNYLDSSYSGHDIVSGLVGSYLVDKTLFHAGLTLSFGSDTMGGDLSAYGALGRYSDKDDHMLRKKLCEGSGWLFGYSVEGCFYWDLMESLRLELSGGYSYQFGSGSQIQSYYEATEESSTGYLCTIGHKFEEVLYSASASISYRFDY